MQFTISRSELARVISTVSRVVESRNIIEILSSLRLTAKDGVLTVMATDLTILAEARAQADVLAEGDICVEAKLFGEIAKKAGSTDVSISLDGDKLIVKSGRSRFSLKTLDARDFPSFGDDNYGEEFTADLSSLLGAVSFASGTNDIREMLNGVLLRSLDRKLVAVATDGHRLARISGGEASDFEDIIIPNKAVTVIPKGNVTVGVSAEKLRVVGDDMSIITKLIGLVYPEYERVIPTQNDKVFTVDRDEMMRAADRVVTVSNEKSKGVRLSIAPGSIQFSARSDAGEAADEVAADYSGEPIEYGLNSLYLRDMLSSLPAGKVKFALSQGMSPAVITGENDNWDGVLMPLRVS
ncbi:DNA polymerase III subunit beta [Agrobacterium tumefaciens]|uniref:DNA polymerase III subunit beta n=1 Tax=Agrobacterium tumefaciens TaxID=358 RepID=UPI0021CF5C0F|nr:DNA polymerase III subunit beta [Agrobacterium tumefaciens]UXS01664.1 DNA polymerase III subunit beta [Agrobacterium tumefaciens]